MNQEIGGGLIIENVQSDQWTKGECPPEWEFVSSEQFPYTFPFELG